MEFVTMARRYSGCDVLHQDFLALRLPARNFDGVFANASLFHVPSQELPRVMADLADTLKSRGDQPDLGGPAVMREFGRFDRPVAVIGA